MHVTKMIRVPWMKNVVVLRVRSIPAYLHHVFKAQEMISGMLLTWHNLHYFQELMSEMRSAISENRFSAFEAGFHNERAKGVVEPF